jgi:hypothetical protein
VRFFVIPQKPVLLVVPGAAPVAVLLAVPFAMPLAVLLAISFAVLLAVLFVPSLDFRLFSAGALR